MRPQQATTINLNGRGNSCVIASSHVDISLDMMSCVTEGRKLEHEPGDDIHATWDAVGYSNLPLTVGQASRPRRHAAHDSKRGTHQNE